MRHWSKCFLRPLTVSLFFIFAIGLLTPVAAFAGINHAVTFAQNDSPSDPVGVSQTSQVPVALTLFSALVPSFSNSTSSFTGWNTSANGMGTSFSDGATYSFAADIILYAQWTAAYHAVSFSENDSPSDSVAAGQTANLPTSLTQFAGLSPTFQNPNHTFNGWNTAASGGGTSYSDGATYSFAADMTLYAQWSPTTASLNFSVNGGTGAIASMTGSSGSSIVVPSGSSLSFANHIFAGWNTQSSGGGSAYLAGATFVMGSAQTLYAQWSTVTTVTTVTTAAPPNSAPTTLVITFETDGASGIVNPVTLNAGSTIELPLATALSNPGLDFAGWFSSAVGGQFLGQGGSTLTPVVSETAFAHWSVTPPATLSFSSNQGSGSVVGLTGAVGSVVTVSNSKGLSYPGFVFTGWNTAADGSGTNYVIGAPFTLSGATMLYAQWSSTPVAKPESLLIGSVGPFANNSTGLTNVLRTQIREIALAMRSQQFVAVALYGYDSGSGAATLHMTLSTQRALRVVEFLRVELARLHVKSVAMTARGEGEIIGFTAAMFRRVEVFAN